jgi:hypothetical protein
MDISNLNVLGLVDELLKCRDRLAFIANGSVYEIDKIVYATNDAAAVIKLKGVFNMPTDNMEREMEELEGP